MKKIDWAFVVGLFLGILGLGMIFMLFLPTIPEQRQTIWGIIGIIIFIVGLGILVLPLDKKPSTEEQEKTDAQT